MADNTVVVFVALALVGVTFAGGPYFTEHECLTALGWKEYNGHCYRTVFGADGMETDADDAHVRCGLVGPWRSWLGRISILASIESQEENDFIAQEVAGGERAWIGGVRGMDDADTFVWKTKTENFEAMTYTNWNRNQPGTTEDCIEINRGRPGKWNDLPCNRKRMGICKYPMADLIPPIS